VPSCSTIALVVAGMDALGQPVRSSAHRVEEFCRLTGTRPDDRIEPDHIASALEAAASYAPPSARTTYVLNKVDGLAWADAAATLASAVHSREPHRAILLTQRGRVADAFRPGESRSSLHSQTAPRTLYS
jgi:probable selenium-dependent hydroxylase accessory protein YqeC